MDPGPSVTTHRVRLALLEHGVEQPVAGSSAACVECEAGRDGDIVGSSFPSRVVQQARSDNFSRRVVNNRDQSADPTLSIRWPVLRRSALVRIALPVLGKLQ